MAIGLVLCTLIVVSSLSLRARTVAYRFKRVEVGMTLAQAEQILGAHRIEFGGLSSGYHTVDGKWVERSPPSGRTMIWVYASGWIFLAFDEDGHVTDKHLLPVNIDEHSPETLSQRVQARFGL